MSSGWLSKELDLMVAAQLKNHFEKVQAEKRPFVTISREYGCDGKNLAQRIVERMSETNKDLKHPWTLFGKKRLLDSLEELHLSKDTLQMLEEFGHSGFESYIRDQIFGQPKQFDTIKTIGKLLRLMADRGNTVMVGSGSSVLTRNLPNGIHVRLYASYDWRVANHARRWQVSKAEAQENVDDNQEKREAFVKQYLANDVANPALYHLMLNNEKLTLDQMADLVMKLL